MKSFIIAFALIAVASAQVVRFSKCPNYSLQKNFDPDRYFRGRFYEQKRFWTVFQVGTKCVYADYKLKDNGQVEVKNSAYNDNGTKPSFTLVGNGYCEAEDQARCHVRFREDEDWGDYNVLETDYYSYGLVYVCKSTLGGFANLEYAWILTRDKGISEERMQKYVDVFKRNGIDVTQFQDTIQDCLHN